MTDLRALSPSELDDARLVSLLVDTVNAGASVNYLAPLDPAEARRIWAGWAADVEAVTRAVLADDDHRTGCVHLSFAHQPNGAHRAEVQKMLVHPSARRRGLGRVLLTAAEEHARAMGRHLLVLDTEKGGAGEALYEVCGWQRVGEIPQFARSSDGSELVAAVLFYKLLTR